MPGAIFFPQYRDEHASTRYPFADSATLGIGTAIVFDQDMFVDAVVYPPGATARLGIRGVDVQSRLVRLWIGSALQPKLASTAFDPTAAPERLAVVDPYGRPCGLFLTDPTRLAIAQTWPTGSFEIPAGVAEFVASCCIPVPETGLQGIVVNGELLTGEIWLTGDDGVVLTASDERTVRIDLIGDPLSARHNCQDQTAFDPPVFIKTINGIGPDEYGNWQLVVGNSLASDTVLRVLSQAPDQLQIGLVGKQLGAL